MDENINYDINKLYKFLENKLINWINLSLGKTY